VVVTGAGDGDGYLVEVADRGLGMTGVSATVRLPAALLSTPAPAPAGVVRSLRSGQVDT
jgi:hypothetical protein